MLGIMGNDKIKKDNFLKKVLHLLKFRDRIRYQIKKGHRKGVEVSKMKIIWKVTGRNLKTLYIEADSFDSAIVKARNVNKNYCSGQVVRNENKQERS